MTNDHPLPILKASRRSRLRSLLAWVLVLGAYATLGVAWGVPARPGEDHWPLLSLGAFMVRTFTFHAGLAAAGLLAYCLAFRLRRQSLALLPIIGFAIVPPLASWLPKTPPRSPGATFTLLNANVLLTNTDTAPLLSLIREVDPDIVTIEEYTPSHHASLSVTLRESHPHAFHSLRDDAFGMAIYSKFPFAEAPRPYPVRAPGAPGRTRGVVGLSDPQVRAVVRVGGREVVVQCVHAVPPINASYLREQREVMAWLAEFARAERRPLVVTGDFNATPDAATSTWLREAGLLDAHRAVGRGRGCTWPALGPLRFVPGIRIDHVLTGGGLRCESIRVGPPIGSDHLPIIARLRVQD